MKNEGQVFGAILKICEGREHGGSYSGNGHHLAQEIFHAVEIALLPNARRAYYECVSVEWERTVEIANRAKRSLTMTSHILHRLHKDSLIDFKREKGVFYWRKLQ